MDNDYQVEDQYLANLKPGVKAILSLLLQKYNNSNDDDVLQNGVKVSYAEIASSLKISKAELPDRVFRVLDVQKSNYADDLRSHIALFQSIEADEEKQEFTMIINPEIFA